MTEAFITPALLIWARERNHLTIDAASKKLGITEEKLASWENGQARPTMRQAQELAKKFRIPFGYLYLSSPPQEKLPLPDLRTIGDQPPIPPSPDFYDLLSDVLAKQEWYREYKEDEGAEPLQFVARYTIDDDISTVAKDIRETIGINDEMRKNAASGDEFFRDLVKASESIGILVLRSGVVGNDTRRILNVEEFRGFAISDDLAPLVFINSRDAKAAQIFTLAHEIVHIWIGQTGISKPDYRQPNYGNMIERFSNRIAAEVLVPKDDFLISWRPHRSVEQNVQALRSRYWVSSIVILRQALDTNQINWAIYQEYYDRLVGKPAPLSASGGGDFYNNLLARNSATLINSLMAAMAQGRTTYREVASLLNVRLGTLAKIETHLYGAAIG